MRTEPQMMARQAAKAASRAASRAEGKDQHAAEDEEAWSQQWLPGSLVLLPLVGCPLPAAAMSVGVMRRHKPPALPHPSFQPALLHTACRLVVMHCVAQRLQNLSSVGSPACCTCPEAVAGHVLSSCTCPLASLLSMAPLCLPLLPAPSPNHVYIKQHRVTHPSSKWPCPWQPSPCSPASSSCPPPQPLAGPKRWTPGASSWRPRRLQLLRAAQQPPPPPPVTAAAPALMQRHPAAPPPTAPACATPAPGEKALESAAH